MLERMKSSQLETYNLTKSDLVKDHLRYLVNTLFEWILVFFYLISLFILHHAWVHTFFLWCEKYWCGDQEEMMFYWRLIKCFPNRRVLSVKIPALKASLYEYVLVGLHYGTKFTSFWISFRWEADYMFKMKFFVGLSSQSGLVLWWSSWMLLVHIGI